MENEEQGWRPLTLAEARAHGRRLRNRWGTYGRTSMLSRHLNRNTPYRWQGRA